ncbi:hypothetical protein WJX81_001403 [Elliptochloris bilobata]|uniref:non-specific serine/threonine protein kinase n=1 Tax=Elliptochloris bilobata TaxID=381761 RepID=A0AAW1RR57_9CHLO
MADASAEQEAAVDAPVLEFSAQPAVDAAPGKEAKRHGHKEKDRHHRRRRSRSADKRRLEHGERSRSPHAKRRHRGGSRDRRPERELERDRERGRGRDGNGRRERAARSREEQVEDAAKDEELAAKIEAAMNGGEDEEARLIEERRRRRQAILAKHQEQSQLSDSVAAPIASELAARGSTADLVGGSGPMSPAGLGLEAGSGARPASAGASQPPSRGTSLAPSRAASPAGTSAGAPTSGGASAAAAASGLPRPESMGAMPRSGDDSGSDDEAQTLAQGAELWQTRRDAAVAAAAAETLAGAGGGAGEGSVPAGGVGTEGPSRGATDRDSASEEARRVAVQAARPPVEGFDMFTDQDDGDMFGATPGGGGAGGKGAPAPVGAARRGLLDNYDDAEGYYNFQVGELMDERYEVFATHGKGVFSTVLRARDRSGRADALGAFPEVAVKVIRANDIMFKAGQTETVILRKLAGADPDGKRHCVRLLRTFEYRHHLCLVFESMDINLRELTKKYGRGIGLNIGAVRAYAAQLLTALYHLRNCGVIHADIKPDNILVAANRTYLKLCDFGSAMFDGENELTPYLVSRFYRAPEVILGLKYGVALDTWSIGAVIYELYTGRILFPGRTNNEMLKLMMDTKGALPRKMLRRAAFADKHFEDDVNMSFRLWEEDPVSKRPVCRLVSNPVAKRDFGALLAGGEGDKRQIAALADLLERLTALDPDRRLSPKEALRHPFIKGDKASKG